MGKTLWGNLVLFSEIGLTMVSCIVLGYCVGEYVGRFFGGKIWFPVVGSFVGVLAGFFSVYKLVERGMDSTER